MITDLLVKAQEECMRDREAYALLRVWWNIMEHQEGRRPFGDGNVDWKPWPKRMKAVHRRGGSRRIKARVGKQAPPSPSGRGTLGGADAPSDASLPTSPSGRCTLGGEEGDDDRRVARTEDSLREARAVG